MRYLFLSIVGAVISCGQASPGYPPSSHQFETANLPAERIGPNDLIGLTVYDSPELTRTIRVGPDGFLRIPMVQDRLKVSGLMPGELEVIVADALKSSRILVNPMVTITVAEYHSKPISVIGAVRMPVSFQAVGNVTLIDAITRAEGLSGEASGQILVSTIDGIGNRSISRRILYRELMSGSDPSLNLRLTGGEEIRVPVVGKIIVVGSVKKPGQVAISDTGAMTVMKAIALSEGLAPYAAKVAYVERLDDKTNMKVELSIPLKRIVDRKDPDFELQTNDTLYIPDDRGSRMTATALERILGFGATVGSGFLIWH